MQFSGNKIMLNTYYASRKVEWNWDLINPSEIR